jgi:hypothetical protein
VCINVFSCMYIVHTCIIIIVCSTCMCAYNVCVSERVCDCV